MRHESRKLLWDVLEATKLLRSFAQDRTIESYLGDPMLRSAVERQLEIAGEALRQLASGDPDLATTIPEHRRIAAFRNVLAHGYASVDDRVVWEILTIKVPELEARVRVLLGEA
jgi:uncharacterized protein with HEPN domain